MKLSAYQPAMVVSHPELYPLPRNQSMKPKSYSEGANNERTAIIAKLKRDEKGASVWASSYIDDLIAWIKKRHSRCDKRPGGLGRKAKKA